MRGSAAPATMARAMMAQPAEKKQRHAPSAEAGEDDQARGARTATATASTRATRALRKKAYVENLKRTVQELRAQVCVKAYETPCILARAATRKSAERFAARAHPRCGRVNPLLRIGRARRLRADGREHEACAPDPTISASLGRPRNCAPRPRSSASIATGARRRPSPTSEPRCANRCCRRFCMAVGELDRGKWVKLLDESCTPRCRSRRTARTRPRRSSTTSASSSASTA